MEIEQPLDQRCNIMPRHRLLKETSSLFAHGILLEISYSQRGTLSYSHQLDLTITVSHLPPRCIERINMNLLGKLLMICVTLPHFTLGKVPKIFPNSPCLKSGTQLKVFFLKFIVYFINFHSNVKEFDLEEEYTFPHSHRIVYLRSSIVSF